MRDDQRILSWVRAERLAVAAHLTLSTLLVAIRGAIRARGDFDRMIADLDRERAAAFGPAALVEQLREHAGSADPLVHGQDIARPLGRARDMLVEPAVAALGHVLGSRFYGAPARFRDTRLVATDCAWSAGAGRHEIRGPLADLLLVATGRAAGLPTLSSAGVERLAL